MSQNPLFTRRDLLNLALGSDFFAQFDVQPIDVTVESGGALGTATVKWRVHGDTVWSDAKLSSASASWTWDLPDPAYASVVLPAAAYIAGDAWTIDSGGTITITSGARAITSTRWDLVDAQITAVSADIARWLQPRHVPPILSLSRASAATAPASWRTA
jgi:hypothetical protein